MLPVDNKLGTGKRVTALLFALAGTSFNGIPAAADSPAPESAEPAPEASAAEIDLEPGALEEAHARIGTISIVTENIFDPKNPKENRRIHHWANAIHVVTRPKVIRTQLLFETGDTYSTQRIEETERLLRSNRYLREAKVSATDLNDGTVDLEVRTSDVWTLDPTVSFGRKGGVNRGGVGLKEFNLLGTGASIGIGYKSDVDRDTLALKFFDRNIFSTRYTLLTEYANASDGYAHRFGFERPFFALDTKRAGGIMIQGGRQTESLYDNGEIAAQFEHKFDTHQAWYGWSSGLSNNWSRRYQAGVGYDAHEYTTLSDGLYPQAQIADDRRYLYPFVGIEILQDDYVTTRNFDQMNRTEDRHLGMRASLKLGYASRSLGSTSDAWLIEGHFSDTLFRSKKSTLVTSADLSGRIDSGAVENALLSMLARYDKRQSEKRLFHVSLEARAGKNLDLENTLYLGGDTGLRGYPLRYQAGDSSLLFSVEQRMFTDWYPFHLFNIGGAVFFDAGKTWGADPVDGMNYGWLRNVGVGLRIGSTRSGLGRMIHIDLAYPLDGGPDISKVQLLVESRTGF
jgi:Omp85 superfamily domain